MTTAPDLLSAIAAAARTAARLREARAAGTGLISAPPARAPRGHAFVEALRASPAPRVIAECKRRSPSKGILRAAYDPAAIASAYASAGAAAISVLTEPTFFDGSLDHLRAVRAAVDLPLLRKDFIVTEFQVHEAAASGADAVLLIVGGLGDSDLRALLAVAARVALAALVEVHDQGELERALAAGAGVIGVNSRNLRTLSVDPEVLERLRPQIPDGVTTVAESGIRTPDDLRRLSAIGYDACLVGERLVSEPDPGAALRALRAT